MIMVGNTVAVRECPREQATSRSIFRLANLHRLVRQSQSSVLPFSYPANALQRDLKDDHLEPLAKRLYKRLCPSELGRCVTHNFE